MEPEEEYGPWCPDIGEEHDWGAWEANDFFPLRMDRFCSKCGGMEWEQICTDPDCQDHGVDSSKPEAGTGLH